MLSEEVAQRVFFFFIRTSASSHFPIAPLPAPFFPNSFPTIPALSLARWWPLTFRVGRRRPVCYCHGESFGSVSCPKGLLCCNHAMCSIAPGLLFILLHRRFRSWRKSARQSLRYGISNTFFWLWRIIIIETASYGHRISVFTDQLFWRLAHQTLPGYACINN